MTVREEVIRMVEALPESDLQVVKRMLRGLEPPPDARTGRPTSEEERRARINSVLGSMAHVPGSLEQFLREKREDADREEERYRRRHPEES